MYNNIEILSPAGSIECVKAAMLAGADAVYMGGKKFGARAFAESVTEDSVIDAIKLVHSYGKKLYLTVNTLFKQKELKEIFLYLDEIVDAGVDAFILQDLGVSMLLEERYSNVPLHASTQMTITSSKGVNFVKNLGFSQVVLARELSIKEIKAIKKEVGDDIVLECFVHGSMCYSYSGACLMSSFIGNESGNRGRCKGSCRLLYNNKYLLAMKDMCAIHNLKALMDAGVSSFKIEGRMRKPSYVSEVTKIYRKYIDYILDGKIDDSFLSDMQNKEIKNDEKALLNVYNNSGFTNYYDKHNAYDMIKRYLR